MTKPEPKPSRYMQLGEVARELGVSTASVRLKIRDGQLLGVNVTTRGKSMLRVSRASFETYCQSIEDEARERYGKSA